ncbi:hypothetical protein EIP91_006950 [Steccherinum ochraceum]|uniref:Aldehyde dehydrogenase n=1 Tax=Steccherinum ochraceum TaxID=92696 RepID=A0A4R0R7E2_9APHY|nr:hypothetical protein EIP91_006950 [Steccherinum ochraceum]
MSSFLTHTPTSEIDEIYGRLQRTYKSGRLLNIEYRRQQLYQLARLAQENAATIEKALQADLGKPPFEAAGEALRIIESSLDAAAHLHQWAAPERPSLAGPQSTWDASINSVPKGVVLVISPWNSPFTLTFNPLIGAIAAGCSAGIKPSEHTPTCASLMAQLVPKYLDPEAYIVVNGAVEETNALLTHRWDHIFFTGSGKVGKIIATAAAQLLTPVTLELGGKSPVIVAEDCTDVDLAAKRILWGKTSNAGQVCVTADHVFVVRSIAPVFYEALLRIYKTFWPSSALQDQSWSLLDRTRGTVIAGGDGDGVRKIAPTIVTGVKTDDALMEEEIFGPILPILEVQSVGEAISHIAQQPAPLVIYAFTESEDIKRKLFAETRSGAIVFNDVYSQLRIQEIPFGGFGESGYGTYFGKASFDAFSHKRSFVNIPSSAESSFASRYRPFTEEAYDALKAKIGQHKITDEKSLES